MWNRTLLVLAISAILGAYLTVMSVDRSFTRQVNIGPQLEVRETVNVDRRAYTSLWFGSKTLYLPLPSSASRVVTQTVVNQDRVVWQTESNRAHNRTVSFRLSPSGRFLLLESKLHEEPWVIVDLQQSGKTCTVSDPGNEIPDHAYVYPFSFLRWEEDSGRILALVSGSYVSGAHQQIKIREIWAMDLHNCSRVMIRHCEKPWSLELDWSDTDCK